MSFWTRQAGGLTIRGWILLVAATGLALRGVDTIVDTALQYAFGPRAQTITVKSSAEPVRCRLEETSYGSPIDFYELPRHMGMQYAEIVAMPREGLALIKEVGQKYNANAYFFVNRVPAEYKTGQIIQVTGRDMLR